MTILTYTDAFVLRGSITYSSNPVLTHPLITASGRDGSKLLPDLDLTRPVFSQGDPGPEGPRGLAGEVGSKGAKVGWAEGGRFQGGGATPRTGSGKGWDGGGSTQGRKCVEGGS